VLPGRAFLLLAGALVALALLAAGCGDDDPAPIEPVPGAGGNDGPSPLDKGAFIAQADAICGEANAALAALDTGDPGLQATQELQITRSQLDSLQALGPPEKGRSILEDFLSALQDQVDALGQKQTAIEQGGDTAAADTAVSSAASSAQAAAQAYGFEDCASASAPASTSGTATAPPVTTTTAPPATVAPPPPPPSGGTGGDTGGGTGGDTGGSTGGGGGGGTGGGTGGISP
jgi:hypothetical protein